MLTISKPLSASQAQTYHAKEFTSAEQTYWREDGATQGEWQGKLAARFELAGAVGAEEFARLSEGRDPHTGEQLVCHRIVQEYEGADGKTYRAGGTSSRMGCDVLGAQIGVADRAWLGAMTACARPTARLST